MKKELDKSGDATYIGDITNTGRCGMARKKKEVVAEAGPVVEVKGGGENKTVTEKGVITPERREAFFDELRKDYDKVGTPHGMLGLTIADAGIALTGAGTMSQMQAVSIIIEIARGVGISPPDLVTALIVGAAKMAVAEQGGDMQGNVAVRNTTAH